MQDLMRAFLGNDRALLGMGLCPDNVNRSSRLSPDVDDRACTFIPCSKKMVHDCLNVYVEHFICIRA